MINFKKTKKWYPLDQADMAHYPVDAVSYWNSVCDTQVPKSESIREWMLTSSNYEFELSGYNRSDGAKSGIRYQDPINY